MLREELYKELSLPYQELVNYLLEKYGAAQYDYFCNETCRSKNRKVGRINEGLVCHHIREDKGVNLSNSWQAKRQPFEWQRKENLVYCNWLEHLVLHIKIAVLRQKHSMEIPWDIRGFFSTGGIFMICRDINDAIIYEGTNVAWRKRCYENIKENCEEYTDILSAIIAYIDKYYTGEKDTGEFLKVGGVCFISAIAAYIDKCCTGEEDTSEFLKAGGVCLKDRNGRISAINYDKRTITVELKDGTNEDFSMELFAPDWTYTDMMNYYVRTQLSEGTHERCERVYDAMNDYRRKNIEQIVSDFRIDYSGYGFPQFTDHKLDGSPFEPGNVAEYI